MEEGRNGVMRILSRRRVLVCVVAMPLCSLLLSCNSDDDAAEENVIGPDSSAGVAPSMAPVVARSSSLAQPFVSRSIRRMGCFCWMVN